MSGIKKQAKRRVVGPNVPSSPISVPRTKKARRTKMRSWEESFQALVAYKKLHGDCDIPERYVEDPALGHWVSNVRSKSEQLSDDQRRRLDELGFDFTPRQERMEQAWRDKYKRLKAFRLKNGHCCVSQAVKEDTPLATWVAAQRKLKKKGRLAAHRVQKLDAIDFTWEQRPCYPGKRDTPKEDEKWMAKYERLVKFKAAHGHCIVPNTASIDRSLGTWVSQQRVLRVHGDLREDRQDLLDEIGFVWKIDKADPEASLYQREWEVMFGHLKAYKREYGHVDLPLRYTSRKYGLGSWLSRQRREAKNGSLDSRRAEMLRKLGVTWETPEERWNQGFENLIAFKAKYGHCNISSYVCDDFFAKHADLVKWVKNQRFYQRRGTLPPERKAKLDSVGFVWRYDKDFVTINEGNSKAVTSNQDENDDDGRPQHELLEQKKESTSSESNKFTALPLYPVGTRFIKKILFWGCCEGRVKAFDGKQYLVHYPADGDEETLQESDFDKFEILDEIRPRGETTRQTSQSNKEYFTSTEPNDKTLEERENEAACENSQKTHHHQPKRESKADETLMTKKNRRHHLPRYPIGLQFVKRFEGHGSFGGRITAFDGEHYKVMYPADGDEEELSEWEFESDDNIKIVKSCYRPQQRQRRIDQI